MVQSLTSKRDLLCYLKLFKQTLNFLLNSQCFMFVGNMQLTERTVENARRRAFILVHIFASRA